MTLELRSREGVVMGVPRYLAINCDDKDAQAIEDALLQRNGALRVWSWWEEPQPTKWRRLTSY